jgi:hypothetical protein
MRTDTVTFCDGWNILTYFDERINSEEQNLTADKGGFDGFGNAFYRGSTRMNEDLGNV